MDVLRRDFAFDPFSTDEAIALNLTQTDLSLWESYEGKRER